MLTVYSRILCFMPKKWLLYLPGAGPGACRAREGGSFGLFGWAFSKPHCPGIPWRCAVRFCLACLALFAHQKAFPFPGLEELQQHLSAALS